MEGRKKKRKKGRKKKKGKERKKIRKRKENQEKREVTIKSLEFKPPRGLAHAYYHQEKPALLPL